MARNRAILFHDCGVRVYAPTTGFDRYRIMWRDPTTRSYSVRTFHERELAEVAFAQIVEYVKGMTRGPNWNRDRRRSVVTVDDLYSEVERRWALKNRSPAYIDTCRARYITWVRPVCGELPLLAWGDTDEYCLAVLAAARRAGRSPATIQGIGALMRLMVTTAHVRKFLPRSMDPMEGVEYVAGRRADDEGLHYVPASDRPTLEMVQALAVEFGRVGSDDGRWWLELMVQIAGFGGLRLGELTALRPEDVIVTDEALAVVVRRAWSRSREKGHQLRLPKNGRQRRVLLPHSLREPLLRRADEVGRTHGREGLLFPGPKGPKTPFSEGEFRRLFERCARGAGWDCVPDSRSPTGKHVRGHPVIPWRNLRHHAAIWMREVAGFDWADVSRSLGHASVAFTHSRYVRPGADAERRNAARLAAL